MSWQAFIVRLNDFGGKHLERLKGALLSLLVVAIGGCTYLPAVEAWQDGALAVQARFPGGRRLQLIPEGTTRIEVRVSGEGVSADSVLAATLTPDKTQTIFTGVPQGRKRVVAKAYDAEGLVLAAGESDVTIVAGATVAARLRLALLVDTGQFELVLE